MFKSLTKSGLHSTYKLFNKMKILERIKNIISDLFTFKHEPRYTPISQQKEESRWCGTFPKKKPKKSRETICFKCHNELNYPRSDFLCRYCNHRFCSVHRLPEDHNCTGNPRSPPKDIMEIWTFGKKS